MYARSVSLITIVCLCSYPGIGLSADADDPAVLALTAVRERLIEELKTQEDAHAAFLKSAPTGFTSGIDLNTQLGRLYEIGKWCDIFWQAKLRATLRKGSLRRAATTMSLESDNGGPRWPTASGTYDLFFRYPRIPGPNEEIDALISGRLRWLKFQILLCDKVMTRLTDAYVAESNMTLLIEKESAMLTRVSCLKASVLVVDLALFGLGKTCREPLS